MAGLLGTWWWRRRPAEVFGFLKKTMVVSLCPVIPALAAMAAHNWATTGSWHRMPYQLHEHQYGIAPLFVWGTPKEYNANTLADQSSTIVSYHTGWSLDSYTARAGILGWLQGIAIASLLLLKYWGVMLGLLPILTCLFWLRFELARWLCVALMFQIIASSSVCWIFTHYLAPVMPWLVVLSIVGLRQAGVWLNSLDVIRQFQLSLGNKQPPLGNASVLRLWGVAGGCALLAQFIVLVFLATKLNDKPGREWAIERALIEERLQAESGEHLVMVHYAPGHNVHEEWVYNWADLERSKVLWARGERADWNGALFAKYKEHRKIWSLNIAADGGKPVLLAISEPNSW
jgi:hypothetical protein